MLWVQLQGTVSPKHSVTKLPPLAAARPLDMYLKQGHTEQASSNNDVRA